jgi:hypothetical protein
VKGFTPSGVRVVVVVGRIDVVVVGRIDVVVVVDVVVDELFGSPLPKAGAAWSAVEVKVLKTRATTRRAFNEISGQ